MCRSILFLFVWLICFPACANQEAWLWGIQNEGGISTENNSMVFFENGEEKFTDLFAAIRKAEKTIHMEYFNFRDDSIANALFDLLEMKVKQGVKVRLLYDDFGNRSNNAPINKQMRQVLQLRGLNIYSYRPAKFPWLNYAFFRDHRKIVVIDGVLAYSGGMNVADYYINGKPEFGEWRDMHFRIEGEAVDVYQDVFLKIWHKTTGESVCADSCKAPIDKFTHNVLTPDTTPSAQHKQVMVVNREPKATPSIMRDAFVTLINHAQSNIQLVNPYLTLRHSVRSALKKALKRGVKVQIMVSEKCDIPITPRIVDQQVRYLQKRGAEVYYFQGGFHHSKIMMLDDSISFIGSANLDSRSLYWDYEINALVQDKYATKQLQDIFNHDKQNRCVPLTDEYWKQKPRFKRVIGWMWQLLIPFV